MIKVTLQMERLPKGVNKGMMTILFKARKKENMGNWCPITLLHVIYNIFIKIL